MGSLKRKIVIKDDITFIPLGEGAKQGYAVISADDVPKVENNSRRNRSSWGL